MQWPNFVAARAARKARSFTPGALHMPDVQFAIGVEELPDDDPLIEAMKRRAEEDGKKED
jgi:hypothetical protein